MAWLETDAVHAGEDGGGLPGRLRSLRETVRPVRSMTVTSQLMGLSPDALRKYERGEREPVASALKLIVEYYRREGIQTSADEILGVENEP